MNPRNLKSLALNGIDCFHLSETDRKKIESIGYYRWCDETAVRQLDRLRMKSELPIITNRKLADLAMESRESRLEIHKKKRKTRSDRGKKRRAV